MIIKCFVAQIPDLESLFTAGCSGFAENYMQWPLDLILGGIQRRSDGNVTGYSEIVFCLFVFGLFLDACCYQGSSQLLKVGLTELKLFCV